MRRVPVKVKMAGPTLVRSATPVEPLKVHDGESFWLEQDDDGRWYFAVDRLPEKRKK